MKAENQFDVDDPTTAEKLLRLQTKHASFDYVDEFTKQFLQQNTFFFLFFLYPRQSFKVAYPDLNSSWKGYDHPIQVFWENTVKLYLHRINPSQLQRIDYLSSFINQKVHDNLPFKQNSKFWSAMKSYINPKYLNQAIKIATENLDSQNWISTLYMHYLFLVETTKKLGKSFYGELKSFKENRKTKQRIMSNFNKEKKALRQIMRKFQIQNENEVDSEISMMISMLRKVKNRNQNLLNILKKRVQKEQTMNKIYFIYASREDQFKGTEEKEERMLLRKINEVNSLKEFLLYQIKILEKKQIAESLCKITYVDKKKNQYFFTVFFEEAMEIGEKVMSEKEILLLENYRSYSFFYGYEAGQKSKYNFVYPNLAGFKEIYQNWGVRCRFETAKTDMLQEVKKSRKYPKQVIEKFNNFDMCHQCQSILQKHCLRSCRYSSKKQRNFSRPAPYTNTYIDEIETISPESVKEHGKITNRYENYHKSKGFFVCKRKYCLSCIEGYEQSFDVCYFCQRICTCSRCVRNQLIIKLKKMYSLNGGHVPNDPFEEMLQMAPKSLKQLPNTDLSDVQMKKKAKKLRWHMQSLRLLADMVKRREIKKYKILNLESQNFSKQLKFFQNSSILPKKMMKEDDSKMANAKGIFQSKTEKEKMNRFAFIERLD